MSQPRPSTIQQAVTNYNKFFHPNVCHICKRRGSLIKCPICNMIFYCNEEHLKLHKDQHKDICRTITQLSQLRHINQINSRDLTQEEWARFKKNNLKHVKQQLGRNLEPYEEQIFLFAKSCAICHRLDDLDNACNLCASVNKCSDHNLIPYEHSCEQLDKCLDLNIFSAKKNKREESIPKQLLNVNLLLIEDMPSFLEYCLKRDKNVNTWSYDDLIYTDYFSRPLTLMFGLRTANLLRILLANTIVVHIIIGSFTDINCLLAWEIILHQLLPYAKLKIIIIDSNMKEEHCMLNICEICKHSEKVLQYDCYPMTYDKFIHGPEYSTPHMVMGFDVESADNETVLSISGTLLLQNSPLILTFKSESKAQDITTKIHQVTFEKIFTYQRNKFASYKPYTDYENDSVFYPNQHFVMYFNKPENSSSSED